MHLVRSRRVCQAPGAAPGYREGTCPRDPPGFGGPKALERNEVVERLAVLPEPLESRLISSRRPRAILFQTKSSTIFPIRNPL